MGHWGAPWGEFWGGDSIDHEAEALARIIEQYKQSPNLKSIISEHGKRWSQIDYVIQEIEDAFILESAEGVQLDVIGRILDLPRGLDTDERYRLRLTTRAQHILPEGRNRIPTITRIVRILTGDDGREIRWYESYPCGYALEIADLTAQEISDLSDFLPLTRPIVYQAWLVITAADGFVYEDSSGSTTVTGNGYGNTLDPAMGGGYANLLEL